MAKKKSTTSNGESISGYFRKVFKENPSWLEERSNQQLYDRWLKDHPGDKEVSEKVRQNLSNTKSVLRNKARKKPGRPKRDNVATGTATARVITRDTKLKDLDRLEEQIDDCLNLAKNLDRDGLATVITLLRRARNEVVWKLGR